jgi:glycosyltransferase involved in cell wall biosynthesis
VNVLVVHNRYRERGGEDRVVALESALLERYGHTVVPYIVDNRDIDSVPKTALPLLTIWNSKTVDAVKLLIELARIDVVHVHNTLPLVSPSVYYAARREGIPVVQTLHNYRLFCASAQCVRDERPCTACLGAAVPWPAIRHACYRGSRVATLAVSAMLVAHRALGTWQSAVDTYIAPTDFARRLLIAAGLPAGRMIVKPHFVDPDPGAGAHRGDYLLYVGRLSNEKGVQTLLDAWTRRPGLPPLTIVGDGPLAPVVATASAQMNNVTWLGAQPPDAVQRLMQEARGVVFPSITFETFGQVIAEAFATGTPVIASDGGAARALVDHGRTGLLFRSGDPVSLATQAAALAADARGWEAMGSAARAQFEERFTAAANYRALFGIYSAAIARAGARFQLGAGHVAA